MANETKPKRDKAEKFRELATTRVRNAIKDLQLIGNLANTTNYEYTEDQVRKIFRALNAEMKALKARFESGGEVVQDQFDL